MQINHSLLAAAIAAALAATAWQRQCTAPGWRGRRPDRQPGWRPDRGLGGPTGAAGSFSGAGSLWGSAPDTSGIGSRVENLRGRAGDTAGAVHSHANSAVSASRERAEGLRSAAVGKAGDVRESAVTNVQNGVSAARTAGASAGSAAATAGQSAGSQVGQAGGSAQPSTPLVSGGGATIDVSASADAGASGSVHR
jgi:hypothetical protein